LAEKILVIVPARNEAATLGGILEGLAETAAESPVRLQTLVIDDGSDDDTASIAARYACSIFRHGSNLGYGAALRSGFRVACDQSYDYAVTIDADGQHRPRDLRELLTRRAPGTIVSGSRYLPDAFWFDPPPAPLVNGLFTALINLIWPLGLTDVGCGMKCIDVALLRRMRLEDSGYLFPLEFWRECFVIGALVEEAPVPMIYCDPARTVLSKCETLEIGLDRALHFVAALLSRSDVAYSPQWGEAIQHAAPVFVERHPIVRSIERELRSSRWSGLPLNLAHSNLAPLCGGTARLPASLGERVGAVC